MNAGFASLRHDHVRLTGLHHEYWPTLYRFVYSGAKPPYREMSRILIFRVYLLCRIFCWISREKVLSIFSLQNYYSDLLCKVLYHECCGRLGSRYYTMNINPLHSIICILLGGEAPLYLLGGEAPLYQKIMNV